MADLYLSKKIIPIAILFLSIGMFKPYKIFADDFKITKISPEGGFSFDAISSISEDKFGFIWFGSSNGVYRYNGVETVKYINVPGNKTSIPGNNVRSLFLDLKKDLWIGTNKGVVLYDDKKENFKRYTFHDINGKPKGINVLQILQTADSCYWMVDDYGFASIDFRKNLVSYLPLPENKTKDVIRLAVKSKDDGRIWLGGINGGIYYCDPPYREISFFVRERTQNVYAILPDGDHIWAGYYWGGADRFDRKGILSEHFGDDLTGRNWIPSSNVRSIFKNKDEIWIGTFKGLVRIKPGGNELIEKEYFPGLQNSSIYQIYRDSGNGIWIGTWSGGLSYINEWANSFEHFRRESFGNSLSDNVVSDFEETSDGSVIASTEEGHLNYLDHKTHKSSPTQIKGSKGPVFSIKSLYTDRDGTLWIGTYASGIYYQKLGSKEYVHFDLIDDFTEQFFDITSNSECMWFGSSAGLYGYNLQNRQIKNYAPRNSDPESLSNKNVRSLLMDSKGNLWIGTINGLNKKNRDSDKFIRYFYNPDQKNRISSNVIYSLMEDSKQHIWIGTAGGGVNIYDPATDSFSQLSKKDGLPGDDVYGILQDDTDVIWMSTENGISAYSPITKSFRNFDYSDGLQGNQFNPGSAFISKNGEIYFGGSNGFTRFDPKKMKENPIAPKTFIVGLEVNNQKVTHESDPDLIKQSLLTLSHLDLAYNQNSIRVEFVANNFLLPQKNRFKYRLKGYSPDWIEIRKDNKAIYTKIPPGNYVFEVMAANNDGKWSDTPTRLSISIHRPFWSSAYAFALYIMVIMVVIYVLQRELRIRNRLRNSILQERNQRENEEKLHQLKHQFFTNISHEFRTPLTLILSPLALLKRKISGLEDPLEQVALIENNANRLLRLVNQLLDIRKIELGKVDFQPQSFDLMVLCREIFQCFSVQENDRSYQFTFEADFSSLFISIEPDKIDKLIFNLLSNAMKYTKPDGDILFSIKNWEWKPESQPEPYHHSIGQAIPGKFVTIIVKNEGFGIDPSVLENIFDRFYQAPGQISGTGIGLHLCAEYILLHHGQIEVFTGPEMGTTFYVRLPVTPTEIGKAVSDTISQTVPFEKQEDPAIHHPIHQSNTEELAQILVVEDNKEMQKFLCKILSEHYHVITANDGSEGLEMVREFGPELVLTDVMMPGMNGNEFCRILKADLNTSHIPVLMLTALSSVESQMEGFETGADDYVVKPFDDRILLLRIKNLLDSRALLREKFTKANGEWQEEMQKFKPERELLDKASEIIERHILDPNFSVDILASELNLSRSSLHRKLRALTNQSATEFIKFVRINMSIRLIENHETNIDDICFMVGFNSHSYFSTCFKKQIGQTPSEYISKFKREAKGTQ
ncbi:MAG: two-component regulator propeller domain-containing protein [Prolixibacteraceae bacterium]